MYKLSLWASGNVLTSRFLIAFLINLLNAIAILWGLFFALDAYFLPYEVTYVLAAILFIIFIIYPYRKKGKDAKRIFYAKRLPLDIITYASCALFFGTFANNSLQQYNYTEGISEAAPSFIVFDIKDTKSTRSQKRTLRKQNRLQKRANRLLQRIAKKLEKPHKELSTGLKVLLFILSIAVIGGLIALLAALSCNISCSGNDTAAVMVFIGGIGIIIWLSILFYRWLFYKPKGSISAP